MQLEQYLEFKQVVSLCLQYCIIYIYKIKKKFVLKCRYFYQYKLYINQY